MELRDSPGRSGGENGPALAKARRLIGGALIAGVLAAGASQGFQSGCSIRIETIAREIRATEAIRDNKRKFEEMIARSREMAKKSKEIRESMSGAEAMMARAVSRVESLRSEEMRRHALRDIYLGGRIDPDNKALDAYASRAAIIQMRLTSTLGYQPSTLSFLYDYSQGLAPAPGGARGRTIRQILDSRTASGEERARVLASLVVAAGGEAYLAPGGTFVYAVVKKDATADDIREIGREYGSLAGSIMDAGSISGRLFGKDYYLYCEPGRQPFPGLGKHPEGGLSRMLRLETLDYRVAP